MDHAEQIAAQAVDAAGQTLRHEPSSTARQLPALPFFPGNKDQLHLLGLFSCQIGSQINSKQCRALPFSIINHPPFAPSPNKVPITHFLFLPCPDNVREAAGLGLIVVDAHQAEARFSAKTFARHSGAALATKFFRPRTLGIEQTLHLGSVIERA